jgi:hypothetical protein
LSLTLSRPITITEYVLSKWFAVATGSAVVSLLQLAAQTAIAMTRVSDVHMNEILINGGERVVICFGICAVMTLCSCLVSGVRDLGVYLLISIIDGLFAGISTFRPGDVPIEIGKQIASVVVAFSGSVHHVLALCMSPTLDLKISSQLGTIPWLAITEFLAVITVTLSLAIFSLNRRELPYGAA